MPRQPAPSLARALARTRLRAITGAAVGAVALLLLGAGPATALNFSAGQNADLLLGAPDFVTPAHVPASNMTYGMSRPTGVAIDSGGTVWASDHGTNRVMRWGTSPTSNGQAMTNVLMRHDASQASWRRQCSGSADGPEQMSVTADGARLAVADRFNNRVVLFTTETTTDGPTGTIFLGQASGGGCSEDRGGLAAGNTLDEPSGVWTDGTRVAVADSGNNRVLLWDSWPTSGQAADHVLGQPDFTSTAADRGGPAAANTLDYPKGVAFDGTWLYVTDANNHRVLAWNGWPAVDGAAADRVIGQPDFATVNSGCTSSKLWYPVAIATTGTGAGHRIAVSSQRGHRVLVLDAWPTTATNSPTFSSVIGQGGLGTCIANRGGSPSASSLREPDGLTFESASVLWVADSENHRVLRFPSLATGASADRVLGHANFTTANAMDGHDDLAFRSLVGSTAAASRGVKPFLSPLGALFVLDGDDHSVRGWTTTPTVNNAPFDLRLGHSLRTEAGMNGTTNVTSATTLHEPRGGWTDGTRFAIADTDNDRVLLWTTMPSSDIDPPDYVLGQPNFSSTSATTTATGLFRPSGVASDGVDVFIADRDNHRVLVYRNFWLTPSNGKAADIVLGQTSFTTNVPGVAADQLEDPRDVSIDDRGRLAVADENNHRVLVWNSISTLTNGQPADVVIGQASFTAKLTGTATDDVHGVAFAGGGLLWVHDDSVRYLDPVPATGATSGGTLQVGTGGAAQANVAQNRLDSPGGVSAANGRVWIGNAEHGRLMRWTDTTAPTITAAPTATVRCDGTVTISWTTSESTTREIRWDSVSRASWAGGYANQSIGTQYVGPQHTHELSFATPGTRYVRVRAVDWNAQEVISGEVSFTVPATCPAPTTMLADDANAQAGTGRANPSATNVPPIRSSTFRSSWLQSSGVSMDAVQATTWTTPPEHAGGLWHLDGGSGAADPNALTSGAATWVNGPTSVPGRFGTAMSFNGTNQYGTVPHAAGLSRANDFTVDAWFRTSDISGSPARVIVQKAAAGGCIAGCTYSIEARTGPDRINAVAWSSGGQRNASTPLAPYLDNNWHHVAMTVDAGNALRLYIDGALVAGPVAMPAPVDVNTDQLAIGAQSDTFTSRWKGDLDEVRFAPVAYDAAAIAGYYRTSRSHAQQLHATGTTALATCATATRCADQAYAGPADILRPGARYWQRTRLNTVNNDYWSDWGTDWLEVDPVQALSISVGSSVPLGSALPGQDSFGSSTVQVSSTGASGYRLLARDQNDSWGLERDDGLATLLDRQDGAMAPAVWPAGSPGFGVTVRDATGGRLAKWGTAGGPFAMTNVVDNLYTSLESTSDVVLHRRDTYATATDTVVVTWRANAGASQAPGAYEGQMTLTAVANP